MAGGEFIFSVSKLNDYANSVLSGDARLRSVKVSGELSGCKLHYSSGHLYFVLKDEAARISCVMFKSSVAKLRTAPRDGMKVVVSGSVAIYPRDGQFQLYVNSITEAGEGDLYKRFLELKQKLDAQGIFARKRPIPSLPKCVGIVTSETGAALHDICTVIRRRFPSMDLLLAPASVQGENAPRELIAAIGLLNELGKPDVIIVGRGGGSYEDLSCFNDECLARAIYSSNIPIISAVGHEIDFTIADFAADLRAATPSAAAELCVPELSQLSRSIDLLEQRAESLVCTALRSGAKRVSACMDSAAMAAPQSMLEAKRTRLESLSSTIKNNCENSFKSARAAVGSIALRLEALSPDSILKRGFALVTDENGQFVKNISDIGIGSELNVRMTDGTAGVVVKSVKAVEA